MYLDIEIKARNIIVIKHGVWVRGEPQELQKQKKPQTNKLNIDKKKKIYLFLIS